MALDYKSLGWGASNGAANWRNQGKWNPETPVGIENWQNWAATSDSDAQQKYANTVGQNWDDLKGVIGGLTIPTYGDPGPQVFQPDLYPESGSTTASDNNSVNFSNNQSSNVGTSTSSSESYTGLDYDNPYTKGILDQFQTSMGNYRGDVDAGTQAARDLAESNARQQVRSNLAPSIDKLASLGILGSSVGKGAIGDVLGQISQEAQQQNYMAGIDNTKMKAAIPDILTRMANANRMSRSKSSGTSTSRGTSVGTSQGTSAGTSRGDSWSKDPSVPYNNLMQMFLGMG